MKKTSKLITLIIAGLLGISTAISVPVFAAQDTTNNGNSSGNTGGTTNTSDTCNTNIPEEVRKAAGCANAGGNTNELQGVISNILKSIIGIAGTISVIYIIIGGIQYMTSSGDSSKTEKAKKTILYACIGLVICALAFIIVQFAIDTVANA